MIPGSLISTQSLILSVICYPSFGGRLLVLFLIPYSSSEHRYAHPHPAAFAGFSLAKIIYADRKH